MVKDQLLPLVMEQGDTALLEPAAGDRLIIEGGGELLLVRVASLTGPGSGPG